MDGNYNTSQNVNGFRLYTPDRRVDQSFVIKSLKIYAPKDSFTTATVKAATNQRFDQAQTQIKAFTQLQWQSDEHGDYVELTLDQAVLSYGYQVDLGNEANIKEVSVQGTYLAQNLLNDAEFSYDGQPLDAQKLTDNAINSDLSFSDPDKEHTIEITLKDGNVYNLQNLLFTANYPESQGLKTIQVGYFQDGKWIDLDKQTLTYQSDDQKRELYNLALPNIQTNKLRLKVTFNGAWNKGIISELNVLGEKQQSPAAIANLLDHVDNLAASSSTLSTNWLKEIDPNYASKYDVQLVQTSNTAVVSTSGQVTHGSTDQTVKVQYQVTDKLSKTKALSPQFDVTVPKSLAPGYVDVALPIDKTTAYKNPAMGWVAYIEGFECSVHNRYMDGKDDAITNPNAQNKGLCLELDHPEDVAKYWQEMDQLINQGMPINILYIREPWSWFEPTEGQYAWNDPNSILSLLVKGAKQRNIQLAFRVLPCSAACAQQATPEYVFTAGTKYETKSYDYVQNVKEPYIDDPTFQAKFKTFLTAFGKEFNNEQTAFVDANGLGEWGEQNNLVFTTGDKNKAVDTLMDYYVDAFPNVLLGGQQGSSQGGQAIANSFDVNGKNFVVRRDAFGSDIYLRNSGNAAQIKKYRQQGIPVFAENCYHHFQSRDFRWSSVVDYPASGGGVNEYGGDDPFVTMQDMMDKVVYDALDLGANTIDLRTLEDSKLWMQDGQKYLQEFTQKGGYRISVTHAQFNNNVGQNDKLNITTTWQNNGVGILPNKNKRWNNKMKVAYALIDQSGKIVKQQIVSSDEINPGDFEKGTDYQDQASFDTTGVNPGNYRLAVAILNTRDNNNVGVQLANDVEKTNDGWVTLGNVAIQGQKVDVQQSQTGGEGTISFDKTDLIAGQPATMTVTPKTGYQVKRVLVNGQEVTLDQQGRYYFAQLPATLALKVEYEVVSDSKIPAGQGTDPVQNTNQSKDNIVNTSYTKNTKSKLPQTGEKHHHGVKLTGLALILATLGAWFKLRR